MKLQNYDYDNMGYPLFSDEELEKNRYRIVKDAYWNANNLTEIIEKSYDTSKVHGLPNRKEEIVFSLVALACELYLKSLAYSNLKQTKMIREHDLWSLFKLLPDKIQERIIALSAETNFYEKLEKNKNVFVVFRYSYEMKGFKINASFLIHLLSALRTFCIEYYPEKLTDGDGKWYRCGYGADGVFYRIEIE